jgi:hypothetical protein
MTVPHPQAAGSLVSECAGWARRELEIELRWWQRLVLARLLEVDALGNLLWLTAVLSMPRQVGKSWLLRVLAMWRIHQRAHFGEEQTVMHISRGLSASREVQRAARVWARGRKADGYGAREQNGAQEVSTPDGSRWLIRDQDGVYSFSASLAIVDEAWGVDAAYVDEGLEPTLPERKQPQIVLVSTAHGRCSSLMVGRRAAGVERLWAPGNGLLVEWSAPSSAEVSLEAARLCSPCWSRQRETVVAAALERARAGGDPAGGDDPEDAYRSQHLNQWPPVATGLSVRSEPLLEEGVWAGLTDLTVSAPAVVAAVEDNFGQGCAAAAAGRLVDGRVLVWGQTFARRDAAVAWCELLGDGVRLLAGASIADTVPGAVKAGGAETRAALPAVRDLAAAGGIVHDGGSELAAQVGGLRVSRSGLGGLAPAGRSRSDLVRAAAWCAYEASRAEVPDEDALIF